MTVRSGKYTYNELFRRWEDVTMNEPNINGKRICPKCEKPRLDINGVEDCDFCLQLLTECSLVDFACCGHGNDNQAYISFRDGRRWILDQESSCRDHNKVAETLNLHSEEKYKQLNDKIKRLKEDLELWKDYALSYDNELGITRNELEMAIKNGYEPSTPYKHYMSSKYEKMLQMKRVFDDR